MGWKQITAVSLILAALSGCTVFDKLVYRIDINQGNFLDASAVKELKVGMTKEQVQYLLGPPMLVENGYPNTWYFVQWQQPSHSKAEKKTMILEFNDKSQLVSMKGDIRPPNGFYEPIN
ncbi:outer membrane protein assembly factor BamE [Veronia pacifica]|uniref:Outer membrane protein assembly factor BamE n=1 Tax=Veronia pacifica TaxID=1080227 RepID=A0A1C3E768_9GAMM|nr:outer membrane protein assembly factor BamE [Veronia pacifica]ODA29073.1 hypothetical protein A8L45_22760 [Veronia pacifica]